MEYMRGSVCLSKTLNNTCFTDVKLVRGVDATTIATKVPTEPEPIQQNVVKVHPNNFLADEKSKTTTSNNSSLIDLRTNSDNCSPRNDLSNPNNNVSSDTSGYQDVMFYNVNEKRSPKIQNTVTHHRLCDKASPTYEIDRDKADLEKNVDKLSAKNSSSDNLRGPR